MSYHGLNFTNLMDDDTVEIQCKCGWESTGHEDEDSAEIALEEHAREEEGRMTDRHAGYTVVLAQDLREDDAEATVAALRQIKGVLSVSPIEANAELHIAELRTQNEYRRKLYEFVESL